MVTGTTNQSAEHGTSTNSRHRSTASWLLDSWTDLLAECRFIIHFNCESCGTGVYTVQTYCLFVMTVNYNTASQAELDLEWAAINKQTAECFWRRKKYSWRKQSKKLKAHNRCRAHWKVVGKSLI